MEETNGIKAGKTGERKKMRLRRKEEIKTKIKEYEEQEIEM